MSDVARLFFQGVEWGASSRYAIFSGATRNWPVLEIPRARPHCITRRF
ncbi:MAG: hypothetical protein ACR2NS_14835 [Gemmatimonadaceae bacterium]